METTSSLENSGLIMCFGGLIGKTIISAKKLRVFGLDDTGIVELHFSDKSKAVISASYREYTGNSIGEYPTDIELLDKPSVYVEI